jgi:DNA-binding response OmpR family regulator
MKIAVICSQVTLVSCLREHYSLSNVLNIGDIDSYLSLVHGGIDFSVIIWDVVNPDADQLRICQQIKQEKPHVKIMIMIGNDSNEMIVKKMEETVDYVSREQGEENKLNAIFDFLRMVQNREEDKPDSNEVVVAPGISLDTSIHCLLKNGEVIPLPGKEYELMIFFLNNQGRFVTVEQILHSVWDEYATPENVRQYVYKLRRKLEDGNMKSKILLHRKGIGYMLINDRQRGFVSYLIG